MNSQSTESGKSMLIEFLLVAGITQTTYVVQPGDTLSKIGVKTGHSWVQIHEANSFTITDPDEIRPGMVLQLPSDNSISLGFSVSENEVAVMPGDTLSSIGSQVGISWQTIARVNSIEAPYIIHPGQIVKLS